MAQRRTHICPGRCGRYVPNHHFACPRCWRKLPYLLRTRINNSYQRDAKAHARAMQDAIEWYVAREARSS